VAVEPRAELGGRHARGEHHGGRPRQGPQPPRHAEPGTGRRAYVHDRHVRAQRGGGRDRRIPRRHVGDHVYSFGAQQRPARGPGYLVIVDDHDPGRPGTARAIGTARSHASTITAAGGRPHRRYRRS
jgi:hypothetical protein